MHFYFVFEGRLEIWLQIRINITDGQLNQYYYSMKTFHRFYHQFDQDFMQSLINRILRLDLDFSFGLIVFHKF